METTPSSGQFWAQSSGDRFDGLLDWAGPETRLTTMISQEYVEEVLAGGHEIRSFEVKGPGDITDKAYVAKVARAVMAMGNLRDGGQVCLGIDDRRLSAMLPGLAEDQVGQWTSYDDVSDQLSKYCDPPVTFHIHQFTLSSRARVVVLDVKEFDTEPHVCKRDFQGDLRAGQTYVRPRGKPRTAQVPSLAEMRELHTLAIDKGVRAFLRRAGAAGVPLVGEPVPSAEERDASSFGAEVERAWAEPSSVDKPLQNALVEGIDVPAYIDVRLQPGPYRGDRVRPDQLLRFITEHAVRLRGWPVPMIVSSEPIARHGTWISQDLQAEIVPHVEAWRLFSSGQFLHRRVVATDLRDNDDLRPTQPGARGTIALWDVLLYLVEVAELGARIATSLGASTITFDARLMNIDGRELISGDRMRELHGPYVAADSQFTAHASVDVATLLGAPRSVGIELAQQLLRQFGLSVSDEILDQCQGQILEPSSSRES